MSLSTFCLHFENILGGKARSSLCLVMAIAFVWYYGKKYCLSRILKLNISGKRFSGWSIVQLLFFSPSFVSLCYVAVGSVNYSFVSSCCLQW